MLFRSLSLIALVFVFAACGSEQGGEHDHAGHDHAHHDHDGHDHGHDHAHHDHDHGAEEAGDGVHFGSMKITPDGAVALDDVLAKLVAKEGLGDVEVGDGDHAHMVEGVVAKVEGTVTEVCQVAGCWFRIEGADGTSVFFKMKEHKAVPKDLVGKVVVAEGKAYEDVTSVEMLQHFAEDAGKSKEEIAAITEPKKEYKFFAEGVVLKGETIKN